MRSCKKIGIRGNRVMVQYEMYFTNEYIEEIVHELANIMKLNVKEDGIKAAMQERDKNSPNNLYILGKKENIIYIDCNDRDWVFPLVVKCQEKDSEAVRAVMLKWDNLIREEYGQELSDDIPNVYGKDNTLLNSINRYYYNTISKGFEIKQELVQKYEKLLPDELIEIWQNYGTGSLLGGYLRIINPEEYQTLLNETYFRGRISIPILTTAFGDILTLEEGQYIGMVKYKNGNCVMLAKSFERFLKNIADEYFLEKYFQIPQFVEAVKKLGEIKHNECFGYVPLLGLGGGEKVDNLTIVGVKEHIELIVQLVGKIGM